MGNGIDRLTVELAGFPFTIQTDAQIRPVLRFCNEYFKGFTVAGGKPAASVTILRLTESQRPMLGGGHFFERRVTVEQLRQHFGHDLEPEEDVICAACGEGYLIYHPAERKARLFLGGTPGRMYAPVYRLMWMFLAQALGDLGGFFMHAAAVSRGDGAYLFMGDSGAGKTTLSTHVKSGVVLADDGPIIAGQVGSGCAVYPSPYHQSPVHPRPWLRIGRSPVTALYLLDKNGRHENCRVPPSRSVPLFLQRYIHFWGYLSSSARLAAFDLFTDACHAVPVHYLTIPEGADALTMVS